MVRNCHSWKYTHLNLYRSAPVNIEDIGSVHVRMTYPGICQESNHLIVVEVMIEAATIFINLQQNKGGWPFMVENNSGVFVKIGQTVRSMYLLTSVSKLSRKGLHPRAARRATCLYCRTTTQAFLCMGLSCRKGKEALHCLRRKDS